MENNKNNSIERINRELVYKGSILDIYKDTMRAPNGNIEEWDFVSHRKGAAAVLPVLPDGRVIMVRQYRNALERETIELPAGCRDSVDEDTALTAARELEEETGYQSDDISFFSHFFLSFLHLRRRSAHRSEHIFFSFSQNEHLN